MQSYLPQLSLIIVMLFSFLGIATANEPSESGTHSPNLSDSRPVISENPSIISVPAGTPIKVRLLENLNSQYTKDNERIRFEVVEDVVLQGRVVIRRGAKAFGRVEDARAAKGWGKKGKLEFVVESVEGADGYPLEVDFDAGQVAGNSTGAVAATIYFAPLFGGGVKGKKARLPKGLEYVVTTAKSVTMHVENLDRFSTVTPAIRITSSTDVDPRNLQAEEYLLQEGTAVTLLSLETINSNASSDGEYLFFEVARDVVVNGHVVIAAGHSALGIVGDSRAAKGWGQKGKIEMEILSVRAVDGTPLRLRSIEAGATGSSKTGETVLGVYALGLAFGGAMKGGKVNIPKGTEFTVYLDQSHTFVPNSEPMPFETWLGPLAPVRTVDHPDN